MKKIIYSAICFIMIVSLLAGCGKKPSVGNPLSKPNPDIKVNDNSGAGQSNYPNGRNANLTPEEREAMRAQRQKELDALTPEEREARQKAMEERRKQWQTRTPAPTSPSSATPTNGGN